jgi:hypothetical protein
VVQLINKGTRFLDRVYSKHPICVLIVMALIALVVMVLANGVLAEGLQSVRGSM